MRFFQKKMAYELLSRLPPSYRAYQSGSYIVGPSARDADLTQKGRDPHQSHVRKDFLPYAYLLGGFGSKRDAWAAGGKVVISHG